MISQVARRYAEALFDLAQEEDSLDNIYTEITQLNGVLKENKNLYDVFRSPFISKDEKKSLAKEIFEDKVSKNVKNFLLVLIDNGRTTQLNSIVLAYKELLNEAYNIQEGEVISAIKLSQEQVSKMEELLSKKYGKNIKLKNKIDQDIIGGILVKIGNEQIDGSVKARLEDLKETLSEVIS